LGNRLPVRVYFEDSDFSGFAYHGSYIRFMERGRTELLRMTGVRQSDLFAADGFAFVVVRMEVEFRKPARMDDELIVSTDLEEMRGATMILRQAVLRGDEILAEARVVVAGTRAGRAARIPEVIRESLDASP
jgi:acyl-CoA thioester hydrolase